MLTKVTSPYSPNSPEGMVLGGINIIRPSLSHNDREYSIAHMDDVSALIFHWARALVLGEDFYPLEHNKRYHEHWARLGTTSMEAAGWKKA